MFIPDSEKDDRKSAIKKLMDIMGEGVGKRLAGLKNPMGASIEIDAAPDDEDDMESDKEDMGHDFGDDEGPEEPSEEDKARISELYHKYC